MVGWLILGVLLRDRSDRLAQEHDEDGWADLFFALLALVVLAPLVCVVLVWVAARDGGSNRWTAVRAVLMASTILVLAWLLTGALGLWTAAVAISLAELAVISANAPSTVKETMESDV